MNELTKTGDIHVITMNNGPNLFDPEFLASMLGLLDQVEGDCEGDAGLVLTGQDKFFSNGLNVEVVMGLEGEAMRNFGTAIFELTRRLVFLPIPTVAAVNGHAFAAGAFLALSCDYRIMREDRGWLCISEVDVGVPIGRPMMSLLRARVSPHTARDAVLTGKRYAADDAIAAGFADGKAAVDELLPGAIELAAGMASKERTIFRTLKQTLYAELEGVFQVEQ